MTLLLATLLAAAGLSGCDYFGKTSPTVPTEAGPRKIFALGSLQPVSGLISITGTPGDRLKAIDPDVVENQPVPIDGLLGVLTSYDTRLAQLDALRSRRTLAEEKQRVDLLLARAQLRGAEAKVKEAEARKAEAELQAGQVENLRESAAIAQDELKSLIELQQSDPDLVTDHQVRKQRNRMAKAESEIRLAEQRIGPLSAAAQAALEAAQANLEAAQVSVESLARKGSLDAIDKEIAVAESSLEQSLLWAPGADVSQIALDENPIDAPTPTGKSGDGRYTVLKVFTKPGEMVSQLPVMQLADISLIECVAEVYEADAHSIHVSQAATITSPAFSNLLKDGLRGKVTYVASLVGSPSLDARNPLARKDRSVVEVRIELTETDAKKLAEAAQRIGLQVTVRFDTE